jgi:hypothetical protein
LFRAACGIKIYNKWFIIKTTAPAGGADSNAGEHYIKALSDRRLLCRQVIIFANEPQPASFYFRLCHTGSISGVGSYGRYNNLRHALPLEVFSVAW